MITGIDFANQAMASKYNGIAYKVLDCQGFVEKVLGDAGVRTAKGTRYNWRGSNDMWRNALSWKGTIDECKKEFGRIPLGSWVFIVKRDGGEVERGYHDKEGNATHVGIYTGNGTLPVRDSTRTSTRDGVGYRSLDSFTHVGLCKYIKYTMLSASTSPDLNSAENAVHVLRCPTSTDAECVKALEFLADYLKG